MSKQLRDYLSQNPKLPFKPKAMYFSVGDYLEFYFRDERGLATQIDRFLTVYIFGKNSELIGFKISGVRRLINLAAKYGVKLADDCRGSLAALLFVGAAHAGPVGRDAVIYEKLRKETDGQTFDCSKTR